MCDTVVKFGSLSLECVELSSKLGLVFLAFIFALHWDPCQSISRPQDKLVSPGGDWSRRALEGPYEARKGPYKALRGPYEDL